tara:strand:- start:1813 stop:3762 length:1950 start_codon:yes stop_codon:yes gene_type:complete
MLPIEDIISLSETCTEARDCLKGFYAPERMVLKDIPPKSSGFLEAYEDAKSCVCIKSVIRAYSKYQKFMHVIHSYNNREELYQLVKNNLKYANMMMFRLDHGPIRCDIKMCIDRYHHERVCDYMQGLTHEQREIAEYKPENGELVTVQAFAGTGKTTTLVKYCENNPELNILYVAFNKDLAKESENSFKHLPRVTVSTMHALALYKMYGENEPPVIENLNVQDIANHLDMDDLKDAGIVKKIMEKFFASQDKFPDEHHAYNLSLNNCKPYCVLARSLWENMPLICHDGYLKTFQLKKEKLGFDVILVDECQDCTPAMLDIVFNQRNSIKIFVGDIHQQIYQFRTVANPFEIDHKKTEFSLTHTFRFGIELAQFATKFLNTYKKLNVNIVSAQKEQTKVILYGSQDYIIRKKTVISRTNRSVFMHAFTIYCIDPIVKVHILGEEIDFEYEINCAASLVRMYNNDFEDLVPELRDFDSLSDAIYHFTHVVGDSRWKLRIALFQEHDPSTEDHIVGHWASLQNCWSSKEDADIILTTTHKAKGLEFDNVVLGNDFTQLMTNSFPPKIHLYTFMRGDYIEAYNLLYVAMTRARKTVELNKELSSFWENIRRGVRFWTSTGDEQACAACGNMTDIILRNERSPVGLARCLGCAL